MNKVMVTGLALGLESDACQACNFGFEWFLRYPSIFIWADKILVTEGIWRVIEGKGIPNASPELRNAIKFIFELAKSEGIIDVLDSNKIISPELTDDIFKEVENDRNLLSKYFAETITLGSDDEVPGEMFIDGMEYCAPYIWTVYAALILARAWDAHCLFGSRALNYCKYKFGLSTFPKKAAPGSIEAFKSIFEAYIPNTQILPEYVFADKKKLCSKCTEEKNCKDTYISQIESNLKEILALRDYDEINQLKSVVSDIMRKREKYGGILNPEEIIHDFRDKQDKIRKRMKLIFPKVKRWANVSTILSIPVIVAGVGTVNPMITLSGAALAGLSKGSEVIINLLSSKYSWIGFTNKDVELFQEKKK